jgi:hypothetical protein
MKQKKYTKKNLKNKVKKWFMPKVIDMLNFNLLAISACTVGSTTAGCTTGSTGGV